MDGEYYLVKTDILARTMSFSSSKDTISNMVTIPTSRVREIIAANRAGRKVESIANKDDMATIEEPTFRTEEDSITRFDNQNKRRRNRNRRDRDRDRDVRKRQAGLHAGDSANHKNKGEAPKENAHNENRENREPREGREHREGRGRDRRRNNRSRQRGEGQRREGQREQKQNKEQE